MNWLTSSILSFAVGLWLSHSYYNSKIPWKIAHIAPQIAEQVQNQTLSKVESCLQSPGSDWSNKTIVFSVKVQKCLDSIRAESPNIVVELK